MTKYKNKVCFIQSETVFETEEDEEGLSTVRDYLKIKNSQFLESKDVNKIFNFIYKHANKNDIRRFICHVDSAVLEQLMDRMVLEKNKSSKTKSLLNKCTFVATYSNANETRDKNKATGSMFYFSLSALDTILTNVPKDVFSAGENKVEKEILVVISDSVKDSPYFKQVNNWFDGGDNSNLKKVTISELKDTKNSNLVNEFAKTGGYLVIASLDTIEEYNYFTSVMYASKNAGGFKKQILYIEYTQPTESTPIGFSNVQTVSSSVCINNIGTTGFVGLSGLLSYEICAAVLCVCWKSWYNFKKARVLSLV
jgi:hypothetical protein